MSALLNDIRYALRQLRNSPGFTTVAVLSLALGIGAGTVVFSLVNAILLRSLPVPNPHELRVLQWSGLEVKSSNFTGFLIEDSAGRLRSDAFTYPAFIGLREGVRDLAEVFGYKPLDEVTVRAQREAFVPEGSMVSDNFFSALGVRAEIGRLLTAEDNRDGAMPTTVITHALWEREFGLDPDVLGQPLQVNGHNFTIVGVLPPEFPGIGLASRTMFYVPMSAQPQVEPFLRRTAEDNWWVQVMARLKPTTSSAQFEAAIAAVFPPLVESMMQEPKLLVQAGRAGPAYDRDYYRKPLLLLLGVVGVVILVACANLAGLSLARGAAREHEYAIRAAMGARWRLIRQSFVESAAVAFGGAALGILLALWGKTAISRLLAGSPDGLRYDTALDTTVLAFTLVTALVTALLSGLLPAVRAGRVGPLSALQGRGACGSRHLRLGRALVTAQVALSLVLLSGAVLYARSLFNLVRIDPGFRTDSLLLFQLSSHNAGYRDERETAFYEQVESALAQIPGVTSVAVSQYALLSGSMSGGTFFTLAGQPATGEERPQASRLTVSESFFATMGIPIQSGRGFTAADNNGAPKVVVVNEAFARKYFSGMNLAGQSLQVGTFNGVPIDWQIIGICGDAKYDDIKAEVPPTVYFTFRQDWIDSACLVVRTALPPLTLVPAARQCVAAIDPAVPLANITTQRLLRDGTISQERLFATLCGALAALALLLCCVGLYGLMAYNVVQRTGEFGVRMALGATRRNIAGPVLREALLLASIGVAIGLPAAFAAGRLIGSQLYGLAPHDPLALAAAVTMLLAVAVIAAWLPARHAAKIDPMEALRYE